MPTSLFHTGFEYQALTNNGGAVFSSAQTGTLPTIDTTTFKSGAAAVKIAVPATVFQSSNIFPTIASQTRIADGFYFRFSGNPGVETQIREFSLGNSVFCTIRLGTTGLIKCQMAGGTGPTSGGTQQLSANTWYYLALTIDGSTTSFVAKLRVDGSVVATNATTTSAGVMALTTAGRFGVVNSVTLGTARDFFFDDFIVGSCSGVDDFWPEHEVIGLVAGSDGTHSFTTGDFSTGDAGTTRASSYTSFFAEVDDLPWNAASRSTTVSITQRVIRTTGYVEIAPVAASGSKPTATAVRALMAYSSTAATANTGACIIRNSTPTAVVINGDLPTAQGGNNGALADTSEVTNFFKAALVTAPAAGWTSTEISALRWRVGGSGDITPVPTWQSLMLEVAYPVSAPPPATSIIAMLL